MKTKTFQNTSRLSDTFIVIILKKEEKIHLKYEIFVLKTNIQYHNNSKKALKPMLDNVHTTWKQVDNFHRLIISKICMKSCTCIDENEIES